MHELLDAKIWRECWWKTDRVAAHDVQPVGGMGPHPLRFRSRLDSVIRYARWLAGFAVDSGVAVTYSDGRRGPDLERAILHLRDAAHLRARSIGFSAPIRRSSIRSVRFGLQDCRGAPRFWEVKRTSWRIYLQQTSTWCGIQCAVLSPTGVVIGGYFIEQPPALGALPISC